MAKITDIHDIIVPAQSPVFTAHTYTEVYGGTGGCAIAINGVPMRIADSSNISIWVRSVSGGTGCYLLGTNMNVYTGSPNL